MPTRISEAEEILMEKNNAKEGQVSAGNETMEMCMTKIVERRYI
jgi:hypothetical protein